MASEKKQFQQDLLESVQQMQSRLPSRVTKVDRSRTQAEIDQSGYATLTAMLDQQRLQLIDDVLQDTPTNPRQMLHLPWCAQLADDLRRQLAATGLLTEDYVAVQCTYFEKSIAQNWLVAFHQDLSIPVQSRVAHTALTGWSEKDGVLFVQPPPETLGKLIALRLHIDDCGIEDGALKVIPGSHKAGRLNETEKERLRHTIEAVLCPVSKGSGMAMRPLLLHASSKTNGNSRRRVLHFLFGPPALPYGLKWAIQSKPA